MSADHPRPSRDASPAGAARLVASLYKCSLLLALVAIFLLPFGSVRTLAATLAAVAGFLAVSGTLATVLCGRI